MIRRHLSFVGVLAAQIKPSVLSSLNGNAAKAGANGTDRDRR